MRLASLLFLAGVLLAAPRLARADDPPKTVADGLTVAARASAGTFSGYQVIIWYVNAPNARETVTKALVELGLGTPTPDPTNPAGLATPFQRGKTNGSRIGSVTREKLVDTLKATGVVQAISLRLFFDDNEAEAAHTQALRLAMRAARQKAQSMAQEGGGRLGKLLGVEHEIEGEAEWRILTLTREAATLSEPGGTRVKVTARYQLR